MAHFLLIPIPYTMVHSYTSFYFHHGTSSTIIPSTIVHDCHSYSFYHGTASFYSFYHGTSSYAHSFYEGASTIVASVFYVLLIPSTMLHFILVLSIMLLPLILILFAMVSFFMELPTGHLSPCLPVDQKPLPLHPKHLPVGLPSHNVPLNGICVEVNICHIGQFCHLYFRNFHLNPLDIIVYSCRPRW